MKQIFSAFTILEDYTYRIHEQKKKSMFIPKCTIEKGFIKRVTLKEISQYC